MYSSLRLGRIYSPFPRFCTYFEIHFPNRVWPQQHVLRIPVYTFASVRPCNRRLERVPRDVSSVLPTDAPQPLRVFSPPPFVGAHKSRPCVLFGTLHPNSRRLGTPFDSGPLPKKKKHVPEVVTKSPQKRQLPSVAHDSPPRTRGCAPRVTFLVILKHAFIVSLCLPPPSPGPFFQLDNYYHIVLCVRFIFIVGYGVGVSGERLVSTARAPKGGRIPRPERVFGVCGRSATPRLATGVAQQPSRLELSCSPPIPGLWHFFSCPLPPPPS